MKIEKEAKEPMPYQKTKKAQEFENQAAIVCYARLSELGFNADCFKGFKENMAAFGEWWAARKRAEAELVPVPPFYCPRCGAPQYTQAGFCGGCHPGK